MELTNREWKEFEIGKLFAISAGKSKGLNHLIKVTENGVNYLGATNSNNGVLAYVREVEQMIHKGNAICFIRNGEGSMGYSIYKTEDFIATSDISVGYSDFLNKYIGLFITTVADKVRGKYNFGYKRSETRLKKEKILLPVTSNGKPDYVFMENYMKHKEAELLDKYENYASINIKQLQLKTNKEVEWNSFEIGHLFEIENCKCSKVSELKLGDIPYVGATNRNNGVISFVEERKELVTKGNCIAFICDGEGSVGFSIYKAEDFIGSTTVKVGRNSNLNIYNGMFITTIADTVRSKYNFGFKRNISHLKKERLILPINTEGEPDFEYMENYMKALGYEKLKQYLNYKKLNTN